MSFQPEERYWTDYLRIALPVVGLLLLIGLLWYWATALIGNGGEQPPPTESAALVAITPTGTIATPVPSPTPTAPAIAAPTGPPPSPTAPAQVNPTVAPTPTPGAEAESTQSSANFPTYNVGETVVTSDSANMRAQASTDSDVVEELAPGTQLQITGQFVEGGEGQLDWWPVTDPASGQSGFIREDLLQRPR